MKVQGKGYSYEYALPGGPPKTPIKYNYHYNNMPIQATYQYIKPFTPYYKPYYKPAYGWPVYVKKPYATRVLTKVVYVQHPVYIAKKPVVVEEGKRVLETSPKYPTKTHISTDSKENAVGEKMAEKPMIDINYCCNGINGGNEARMEKDNKDEQANESEQANDKEETDTEPKNDVDNESKDEEEDSKNKNEDENKNEEKKDDDYDDYEDDYDDYEDEDKENAVDTGEKKKEKRTANEPRKIEQKDISGEDEVKKDYPVYGLEEDF